MSQENMHGLGESPPYPRCRRMTERLQRRSICMMTALRVLTIWLMVEFVVELSRTYQVPGI